MASKAEDARTDSLLAIGIRAAVHLPERLSTAPPNRTATDRNLPH